MDQTEGTPRINSFFISSPDEIKCHLAVGPEEVDIYEIAVPPFLPELPRLFSYLSREEKTRAARMVHTKDRDLAICSYGIRRELLGRYGGISPAAISFQENGYGKPALMDENPHQISFNLSHSKNRILLGICRNRNIGVDIQYIDTKIPALVIAERFFRSEDSRYLASIQDDEIIPSFYRIWTAREAYCKAEGMGFSLPAEEIPPIQNPFKEREVFRWRGRIWYRYSRKSGEDYDVSVIVSEFL